MALFGPLQIDGLVFMAFFVQSPAQTDGIEKPYGRALEDSGANAWLDILP